MKNSIKKNTIILFQGDSITDCGRMREVESSLGDGYVQKISQRLNALYPDYHFHVINKGVSGNRVVDLHERWKKDCIDLQPTLVTILVGINDCWRRFDSNDPTSVDDYKETYRSLLTQIMDHTDAEIIIMEPFLLPVIEHNSEWSAGQHQWRVDLDPKIHAVRTIARELRVKFIPLDGIFAKLATQLPMEYWTVDGVHPTEAGHEAIAQEWLKEFNTI